MVIKILSSKDYSPQGPNYGDCILIDTGNTLVVYDCGCEEHAKQVEAYMEENSYSQTVVILSHNDADHFDGIPYLVEKKLVSKVYTHLFLQHKEKILELLDDGRVTKKSVGNRIKKVYANIASLSRKVKLVDALKGHTVVPGITIVGPSEEYALETITKALDSSTGDSIDAESVINAASIQVSVDVGATKALLCGDASFEAIKDKLGDYSVIQLPHHGKPATAEKIFAEKLGKNQSVYLVSDNTGNSNGGSKDLNTAGKDVRRTWTGDIIYPASVSASNTACAVSRRTLGLEF